MTDYIAIDLTGKDGDAWHRVFQKLSDVIIAGLEAIAPTKTDPRTAEFVADIATIAKTWVKSKAQRQSFENEKTWAEINVLFEEAKLKRTLVEKQEIENEKARLELLEKRVATAFRLLAFLNSHIKRTDDGRLVIVLTNESLQMVHNDLRAIAADAADS
jgi:hypothetical protein